MFSYRFYGQSERLWGDWRFSFVMNLSFSHVQICEWRRHELHSSLALQYRAHISWDANYRSAVRRASTFAPTPCQLGASSWLSVRRA